MRILFLDVDGVLNCVATFRKGCSGYRCLDRDKIDHLGSIIDQTGCMIVVSSSWRHDQDFRELFVAATGRSWPFHPSWRTDRDRRHIATGGLLGEPRGAKIKRWLDRHPDTRSYAIVDDDADMLPEQAAFFVQTSFDTGLTEALAARLTAILSAPAV